MANQLHIAYSDVFSGAGILAGVPFGCADASLGTALARCMGKTDGSLSAEETLAGLRIAQANGQIADLDNLKNDPVWLFHGTLDSVVAAEVSDALYALYLELEPADQIKYVNDVEAAHHFPAKGQGHSCDASAPPFIGDCDFDAAGDILNTLYPDLDRPAGQALSALMETGLDGAADAGLSDTAYLYIPAACQEGENACALHLVLHGCAQSAVQLGTAFMEQSGYLPWAEANNIVLAFPQVISGATNPYACWDWWGYTGENYRWRDGAQMSVLVNWVNSI
jgi:poly(3-hydroxybutyrate) depolymerase